MRADAAASSRPGARWARYRRSARTSATRPSADGADAVATSSSSSSSSASSEGAWTKGDQRRSSRPEGRVAVSPSPSAGGGGPARLLRAGAWTPVSQAGFYGPSHFWVGRRARPRVENRTETSDTSLERLALLPGGSDFVEPPEPPQGARLPRTSTVTARDRCACAWSWWRCAGGSSCPRRHHQACVDEERQRSRVRPCLRAVVGSVRVPSPSAAVSSEEAAHQPGERGDALPKGGAPRPLSVVARSSGALGHPEGELRPPERRRALLGAQRRPCGGGPALARAGGTPCPAGRGGVLAAGG